MAKKYIVFLKSIGRKWFLILVLIIIIVAFYNQIAALVITIIALCLFALSFVPRLFFRNKLLRFLKEYYRVQDEFVARKMKKNIRDIQEKMFNLSQQQEKKAWLIIFLNKHYIFYHADVINKLVEFYKKGYSDKEILEILKKLELETRDEVKTIIETLRDLDRLGEREISVQERREKLRFQDI
ncbi:MAG: hypothetical protein GF383_12920 [Candidatus Lokiarchaeota archaeon]|nr:hypothetical protein [Candidatus Lokiarchaeota archaeon]MBD3341989.1 hypothetical protein [Candidatus Lokiarchaeota archaeon]